MILRFFLIATLAASTGLLAQNPAVAPSQASQGSTVIVPPTNIYVVGGGLYGTGVYLGQPAVAVPPPLNTGVSLAGQTGISFNQPVESSVSGTPAPASGYTAYSSYPSAAETSGRLINDMGPSYFSDSEANTGEARPVSLGEVAAQYKASRSQNVRTYTNTDAEQLANRVTITRVSQPSSGTQSQVAQSRPEPAANAPEKPEPAPNATTPPVGPESAPAAPTNNRLPATSSLLPLLALFGVASSGIGLWLRKFLR